MKQNYTRFEHQARYFQLGNLTSETKNLIFVIHGYGQQAKYFIQKFKSLDDGNSCIIAPEGLSRFYLEGFSGRVGATWMTKEDRLIDIKNYVAYLNSVYTDVARGTVASHTKISTIGFSQGSATASRWLANLEGTMHQLILWAGIFPPDLNYDLVSDKFQALDIKYVYGLKDPFLNESRLEEMHNISKHLNVKPETFTFDGEHVIDAEMLQELF